MVSLDSKTLLVSLIFPRGPALMALCQNKPDLVYNKQGNYFEGDNSHQVVSKAKKLFRFLFKFGLFV